MEWSRLKRDARRTILGEPWWIPLVGAVVVFGYSVVAGGLLVFANQDPTAHAGGLLGGLVAGAVLGTNVYDGVMVGFRAATLGIVAIALLATVGTFVAWFLSTGLAYVYVTSLLGFMTLFILMPVYALIGLVGGAVGVVARRMVLPRKYNPPAY